MTISPGLSQSSTPFIACRRQDIPHTPLVAWPRRPRPRSRGNRISTRYRTDPKDLGRSNDPSLKSGLMQRTQKKLLNHLRLIAKPQAAADLVSATLTATELSKNYSDRPRRLGRMVARPRDQSTLPTEQESPHAHRVRRLAPSPDGYKPRLSL